MTRQVVVSVSGGVAEVYKAPANVEVVILDYDNLKAEPPLCHCCHEANAHTYAEYGSEILPLCNDCLTSLQELAQPI